MSLRCSQSLAPKCSSSRTRPLSSISGPVLSSPTSSAVRPWQPCPAPGNPVLSLPTSAGASGHGTWSHSPRLLEGSLSFSFPAHAHKAPFSSARVIPPALRSCPAWTRLSGLTPHTSQSGDGYLHSLTAGMARSPPDPSHQTPARNSLRRTTAGGRPSPAVSPAGHLLILRSPGKKTTTDGPRHPPSVSDL